MAKIQGAHVPMEVKNLIKNGAFDFWQRVEGAVQTVNTASTVTAYAADCFRYWSSGATNKNYSIQRSASVPSIAQSAFQSSYSYQMTMITGIPSFAAGDYVIPMGYQTEGLDYEYIHGGQKVTFGFWVNASIPGVYNFAFTNTASNRSYVNQFTISGSNTWEFKTVSMVTDNTGTWNFDNQNALNIVIGAVSGSTFQAGAINTWSAGNFFTAPGHTNWMATNGATFFVSQLHMVKGPLGLGATGFTRAGKDISQELMLCQRYCEKSYIQGTALATITLAGSHVWNGLAAGSGRPFTFVPFKVDKRTTPASIVGYNPNSGSTGSPIRDTDTPGDFAANLSSSGTSGFGVSPSAATLNTAVLRMHWIVDAGL